MFLFSVLSSITIPKELVINSPYRHILKYTGIFGSIQVVTMLASVLRNKAAAILIDRYGQGLTDLFSNTVTLISTATTLVIPVAVVRRLSLLYERHGDGSPQIVEAIRVIRSWSVLTGLVATLLVIVGSPLLSQITLGGSQFTRSYLFLSPMLLLVSVNGTEVAILKATRRLSPLAKASVAGSLFTLVVSVASYWLWSLRGIVVSLDLSALCVTLLSLRCTLKAYPYRVAPFSWSVLRKGTGLIRLSVAFILAAVVAALVEMLIRTFISNNGSIEDVGLYGAGFALTVTYTRFVFSAMDADYYPRLSGLSGNRPQMNVAINRQVMVCVLIVVPCLILFNLFLPFIVSLLYTDKYREIIPMVMCATFYVFSKAVLTPVAYTSLAKGDSKMYLGMESVSALLLAVCVIGGYSSFGLTGCGIGLTISNLLELAIIFIIYRRCYGVGLNRQSITAVFLQLSILLLGMACVIFLPSTMFVRYAAAFLCAAVSLFASWRMIRA